MEITGASNSNESAKAEALPGALISGSPQLFPLSTPCHGGMQLRTARTAQAGSGRVIQTAGNERKDNMTIKALVLSDRADEYTGKRGLVKQQIITVMDQSDTGERLWQRNCARPPNHSSTPANAIKPSRGSPGGSPGATRIRDMV